MKRRVEFAAIALVACALAGCGAGGRAAREYGVVFRSVTDDGEPLASVRVEHGGRVLGVTDARGALHATLSGQDGQEAAFDVTCPAGYHADAQRSALQLRTLGGVGQSSDSEVELRCLPDKRLAALLVHAPGFAGLPVLVHGREVGRTDAKGVAHLALHGEPRTPMRVVLDTSAHPLLTPPSPHKDVRIGERDEIVVFAPELTQAEPPKPRERHRPKKAPEEPKPIRPEQLN